MAKVRTEDKELLLESGKWGDFVKYRDKLKAEGVEPARANTLSLEKYLPPNVVKAVKDAGGVLKGQRIAKAKAEAVEEAKASMAKPKVDAGVSDADCIRWVADRAGDMDVDPAEAPCTRAFNLWRACKNDRGTMGDFWKAYIAMAMKQAGNDQGRNEEFDGQGTADAIDKLLAIAEESKK